MTKYNLPQGSDLSRKFKQPRAVIGSTCLDDPILNDILGMYGALERRGFDVRVSIEECNYNFDAKFLEIDRISEFLNQDEDIFISHFTNNLSVFEKLLKQLKCRKILRYNYKSEHCFLATEIEPRTDFTHEINPILKDFEKSDIEVWVTSKTAINSSILKEFPREKISYMMPFHDTFKMLSFPSDQKSINCIANSPNILALLRPLTRENCCLLINIMSKILKSKPNAQLFLLYVQDCKQENDIQEVKDLIEQSQNSASIKLISGTDTSILTEAYRNSKVFVVANHNDDLCIPLLSAMAFNLPIISINSPSLIETIGSSGTILENCEPDSIAQVIIDLLDNEKERNRLAEISLRQYNSFYSSNIIDREFAELIYRPLVPLVHNIKTVHQFHSGTASGDAITNAMFLIRDILRSFGLNSEIFAEHIAPELKDEISHYTSLTAGKDDLLLLHHSMGTDLDSWIASLSCTICLVYHNITPSKFFAEGTNLHHYTMKGRVQLLDYRTKCSAAISDSRTNADELIEAGYDNVETIPLLFDLKARIKAKFNTSLVLNNSLRITILFVGRVTRHKCQREFIPLALALKKIMIIPFQIVLVGEAQKNDPYVVDIITDIEIFGLKDFVKLTGKIPDEDLLAWYRIANLFVCLSEHEGFGIPLIEAMSFKIPVIAFDSSAISETLGGAGLLIHKKDPILIATLIKTLIYDKPLRRAIIKDQSNRITEFSRPTIENQFNRFLYRLGVNLQPSPKQTLPEECSKFRIQIEGPFETSYSLALVNRELAQALDHIYPMAVSLYATDGPGDYVPDLERVKNIPGLEAMWRKGDKYTVHDLTIRNLYPPRVRDMKGKLNILNYAWEETGFPLDWIDDFNAKLDGITVTSRFVKKVLIDNGLTIPCEIIGNGTDHITQIKVEPYGGEIGTGFRFLHVSSCFPRKGVDVLLTSYAKAFTKNDDVTLILKTFPNPHNNINNEVQEIRNLYPNCAPIIIINEDLPQGKILDLYQKSHALVAPSRGEGFGLPMAEAMQLGLPVITTGFGGQTDFCHPDNCWLIDFKFSQTESHLGLADSVWAEPKVDSLVQILRNFIIADEEQIRIKTKIAKELLASNFKWSDSAKKLISFQERLISSPPLRINRLKLGWISTWNTKCGIATYSKFLLEFFDNYQFETTILSSISKPLISDGPNVERVWTDRSEYASRLINCIQNSSFDIIVIQFNFGFYSLESLKDIIVLCKKKNIVCVLTIHSTADVYSDEYKASLRDIQSELSMVDRILVHSIADLNRLKDWGLIENVVLFPHGVIGLEPEPKNKARDRLNIPVSSKVIATYGFLLPNKGFLELVEALPSIIDQFPETKLLMVNAIYPDPASDALMHKLKKRISDLNLEANIDLHTNFLEDAESLALLSAADCTIFPYQYTAESASGAIRFGLASKRPVLCTPLSIFSDVAEVVSFTQGTEPKMLAEALIHFFKKPDNFETVNQNQIQWLTSHAFSTIARRLTNLLNGLYVDLHKD